MKAVWIVAAVLAVPIAAEALFLQGRIPTPILEGLYQRTLEPQKMSFPAPALEKAAAEAAPDPS